MSGVVRACIALGSNLDNPRAQVERAIDTLRRRADIEVVAVSRLYGSAPVGPAQPDYVNAALAADTALAPLELLDLLQSIEQQQLRRRDGARWGPRTLDLDLLLYGDDVIDVPRLTVPHPRLAERAFVLRPLSDVCPACVIPGLGVSVAEQRRALPVDDDTVWLLD
ncbi:MAG: 2-amino-4-hydroxy-6-hydroxymethyldihydropteridine diphosphokinase [Pseudomonadota bacterium]